MLANKFVYRAVKEHKHVDLRSPLKIILVYSEVHFDPSNDVPSRQYHYSGITNVGRNIYKVLSGHEITYIGVRERMTAVPKADLVIGLRSDNLRICAEVNPQAKRILVEVNCHPLFRAKALLDESRLLGKDIPAVEWIAPGAFSRLRRHIDSVALIGNETTQKTFLDQGVREVPINPVDLGVNLDVLVPDSSQRPEQKIRFVYPASLKGLRKGLFRVMQAWEELSRKISPERLELYMIGENDKIFEPDIKDFIRRHRNVKDLGWVTDKEQVRIFQSSHIVLAPALEEGQVSAVLEAMATGAVPILTRECGISISDGAEGIYIRDHRDTLAIARSMEALVSDRTRLSHMSMAAIDLVRREHTWEQFRDRFTKVIQEL